MLILLWPLGLSALGLLAQKPRQAFALGWLASFAGSLGVLYWLALPVHNVGGLIWPLGALCAAFIAAIVSSAGAFFALFAWLCRGLCLLPLGLVRLSLALALCWYLLEWAYACALAFPWLAISAALAPWPLFLQSAEYLGAYGASALWLLGAELLFLALLKPCPPVAQALAKGGGYGFFGHFCLALKQKAQTLAWQSPQSLKRGRILAASLGLILMGGLLCQGLYALGQNPLESGPGGADTMAALMVEGNVEQNQKWLPAFQRETLSLYERLSREGLERLRAKDQTASPLVIWPETALPYFFGTRPLLDAVARDFARASGCPLLLGAPGLEKMPGEKEPWVFNRAFLLGPDGQSLGFYDKEQLVPFGEYLPDWLKLPFLEALLQGVGVYHAGRGAKPLRYGSLALGMLICYESIFPWLARERTAQGANILVDISNDGWFGTSPAARQHLWLTVGRALEQGRWIIRATNTGISAVIDQRGRIVHQGGQFQAGSLAARARLLEGFTLYHGLAPWLPWASGLALLSLLAPLFSRLQSPAVRKRPKD